MIAIPAGLLGQWPQHLTIEDGTEIDRLLLLIFKDEPAAVKWLKGRSDFFNCAPLDLIKRDELGVLRVISYLRDAS